MRFLVRPVICVLLSAIATTTWAQAETIIYLHGYIIEIKGTQPVHERYGLYDFNGIVEALEANGATVISDVRSGETDVDAYAREVVGKIEELIDSGVAPEGITVVGFSKGGVIAIYVSNLLGRSDVNFAFLAACSAWISSYPDLTVSGNVLSIYERSDTLAGSCRKLAKRGDTVTAFQEVRLNTKKEHGAFYLPRAQWLEPLLEWIEE